MLEIDECGGDEAEAEREVAEKDQRYFPGRRVGRKLENEDAHDRERDQAADELDQRVARRNLDATTARASAQEQEAQNGNVVARGDRGATAGTARRRKRNIFAAR